MEARQRGRPLCGRFELVNWSTRHDAGPGRLHLPLGKTVEIADLDDYGGFGEGWEYPDETAIWTQGPRSELAIALDGKCEGETLLALSFDKIGVRSDESLKVELLVNGARVATCDFARAGKPHGRGRRLDSISNAARPTLRKPVARLVRQARALGIPGVDATVGMVRRLGVGRAGDPKLTWSVALPARVVADGKIDLTLVIEEPVDWSKTIDVSASVCGRSHSEGKAGGNACTPFVTTIERRVSRRSSASRFRKHSQTGVR